MSKILSYRYSCKRSITVVLFSFSTTAARTRTRFFPGYSPTCFFLLSHADALLLLLLLLLEDEDFTPPKTPSSSDATSKSLSYVSDSASLS